MPELQTERPLALTHSDDSKRYTILQRIGYFAEGILTAEPKDYARYIGSRVVDATVSAAQTAKKLVVESRRETDDR